MKLARRLALAATYIAVSAIVTALVLSEPTRDVVLAGLTVLAIALALAALAARELGRSVAELREAAQSLSVGDLSRRPSLAAPGELGELARLLARVAEQHAGRLAAMQAEDHLMSALLESLQEGVVAVDARRRIVRLNGTARRILCLAETRLPCSTDLLPRERTLREALAAGLAGHSSDSTEIQVDGRTLALTARPLGGGGAVLTLLDVTTMRHLEAVRRDFVANVSHELKTPLTVIGGFAETLATDDVPPAQQRRFVDAVRVHAVRMQRLVDDLLDLSRIESGTWAPEPVFVPFREMAAEVLGPCEAVAASKGVTMEIISYPAAQRVLADPTALQQVLTNLVTNALQHTERGGRVTVFSTRADSGVTVVVRDTGTGIAAEHLPRIFERFYRADPARSRAAGGTGLGLAIVRHLVEAHGGRVWAESTVGQGTRVSAFFPDAGSAGAAS